MSEFNEMEYDALFDSEYDDSMVLTGLDSIDEQEELLGRLMRNPAKRKKLAKKVFTPKPTVVAGQTTSRDDFQKRFKQLPADTRKQLLNKQKQLVDTGLYVVKEISNNKIVKMLQDDDNKVIAKSNISGGKLEKGNFFTIKGIQLLYGVAGDTEDYRHVNFNILPDFVRNGEFKFVANGSILIPSMSLEAFNTAGMNQRMGYFELVNPKMIETQQPMDLEMEWGENAPAKSFVKLVVYGTSVAKY